MKVLFIGEGPHDIGAPNSNPNQPRPARHHSHIGSPRLRGNCSRIDCAGLARDQSLQPIRPKARLLCQDRRGSTASREELQLRSDRRGCRPGPRNRTTGRAGGRRDRAVRLFPQHAAVWGLAIESVEAWTLGARTRSPRNSVWILHGCRMNTPAASMLNPCLSKAVSRSIAPSSFLSESRD